MAIDPQEFSPGFAAPIPRSPSRTLAIERSEPGTLDDLTWTVLGEAADQGEIRMAAIVHVIENRARSGRDPTSLKEIAHQGAQFSAWNEGEGGNNPSGSYPRDSREFNEARKIVEGVLNGEIPDPTYGATHYWSPKGMKGRTPNWAKSETLYGRLTIRGHVFLPRLPFPGMDPLIPAAMSEKLRLKRSGGGAEDDAGPAEQEGLEEAPIPRTPPDDLWHRRLKRLLTDPQKTPGLGRDELLMIYRGIAEEEYIKARGNVGLAKRRALAALKSRYGASRLSGQPVIMEQPPEANYPAVNGGWGYLQALTLQQARSTDPAAQEISLVSDSTTLVDRKVGRPPRYALWYRPSVGDWKLAPAPFSVELERLAALQRLAIEERHSRGAAVVASVRTIRGSIGSMAATSMAPRDRGRASCRQS
jgi:hypothetical protein